MGRCWSSESTDDTLSSSPLVNIWWDIENCPVPKGCSPFAVCNDILKFGRNFGMIQNINVFADPKSLQLNTKKAIIQCGFNLLAVRDDKILSRKEVCDAAIREDMMIWALKLALFDKNKFVNSSIILISSDNDFASMVSKLLNLRIKIHVVTISVNQGALRFISDVVYVWEDIIRIDRKTMKINVLEDDESLKSNASQSPRLEQSDGFIPYNSILDYDVGNTFHDNDGVERDTVSGDEILLASPSIIDSVEEQTLVVNNETVKELVSKVLDIFGKGQSGNGYLVEGADGEIERYLDPQEAKVEHDSDNLSIVNIMRFNGQLPNNLSNVTQILRSNDPETVLYRRTAGWKIAYFLLLPIFPLGMPGSLLVRAFEDLFDKSLKEEIEREFKSKGIKLRTYFKKDRLIRSEIRLDKSCDYVYYLKEHSTNEC